MGLEGIVAEDVVLSVATTEKPFSVPSFRIAGDRIRDRGVARNPAVFRENQHTLRADSGRGRGAGERDQDRARRRNQGHTNAEVSCSGTKAVPSGFA